MHMRRYNSNETDEQMTAWLLRIFSTVDVSYALYLNVSYASYETMTNGITGSQIMVKLYYIMNSRLLDPTQ